MIRGDGFQAAGIGNIQTDHKRSFPVGLLEILHFWWHSQRAKDLFLTGQLSVDFIVPNLFVKCAPVFYEAQFQSQDSCLPSCKAHHLYLFSFTFTDLHALFLTVLLLWLGFLFILFYFTLFYLCFFSDLRSSFSWVPNLTNIRPWDNILIFGKDAINTPKILCYKCGLCFSHSLT